MTDDVMPFRQAMVEIGRGSAIAIRRAEKLIRNPTEVDIKKWAIPDDLHLLKSPYDFRDRVHGVFADPGCHGQKMSYPKTHGLLQFREHEATIWFGYKSSYKSVFLNELLTYWACCGIGVGIASFEMPAHKLVALAVKQALADPDPRVMAIDRALERLAEAMTLYDVMGKVAPSHLLAIMRYCAIELGCQHFLVDNLTDLLPIGNDQADVHQQFMRGVLTIARTTGMHVHLVAHCAKPEKGDVSKEPTGYSIRGTGAVADMADNLIGVWRNIPKEDRIEREPDLVPREVLEAPDVKLIVDKQKFWDYRGSLKFWLDRRTLRFREYGTSGCEPFL